MPNRSVGFYFTDNFSSSIYWLINKISAWTLNWMPDKDLINANSIIDDNLEIQQKSF